MKAIACNVDPMRKNKVVRILKIRWFSDKLTSITDPQGNDQTHSWDDRVTFREQAVCNGPNARQASNKDGAPCERGAEPAISGIGETDDQESPAQNK
jgi:hypothetical protein